MHGQMKTRVTKIQQVQHQSVTSFAWKYTELQMMTHVLNIHHAHLHASTWVCHLRKVDVRSKIPWRLIFDLIIQDKMYQ